MKGRFMFQEVSCSLLSLYLYQGDSLTKTIQVGEFILLLCFPSYFVIPCLKLLGGHMGPGGHPVQGPDQIVDECQSMVPSWQKHEGT